MIVNASESRIRERLGGVRRELPAAGGLLDALEGGEKPFTFRAESPGTEFLALSPVGPYPNRAVIKVFGIADGPMKGRAAVFFYKKSQIPWSRDRHSYGVCLIGSSGPAPGEVDEWISFADSGFDPERRPSRLRQAFTFTVPD